MPKTFSDAELTLRKLDLDTIRPFSRVPHDSTEEKQYGSKIIIIGKPGSGKSVIISNLIHNKLNRIPYGIAISGTESINPFYSRFMPSSFIYDEFDDEIINRFETRQRTLRDLSRRGMYPHNMNWGMMVVDDCSDDPKLINTPTMQKVFKNGRHWRMMFIIALQYAFDLKPAIRRNYDGVFIMRDPDVISRKKLFENYAGIIKDQDLFNALMDKYTENHGALFIANQNESNDWRDCVFWYRGNPDLRFKFGSRQYWDHHYQRYNPNYESFL